MSKIQISEHNYKVIKHFFDSVLKGKTTFELSLKQATAACESLGITPADFYILIEAYCLFNDIILINAEEGQTDE